MEGEPMTDMDPPPPAAPEPASPEGATPAPTPASPPAWQPPPAMQPAWQAAAPAAPPRPARPGMVTAASIVLIVIGVVVALIGLLLILGGALIGSVGDRPDLGINLNGFSGAVGGQSVATVHESVDEDAINAILFRHAEQGVEMRLVGMHTAVREQAEQMQTTAPYARVFHSAEPSD